MEIPELVPLEGDLQRRNPPLIRRQYSVQDSKRTWQKAPLRACRLFALLLVLPALFICIPVYMRYRVFSGQMYPMGMTDMRLIDGKISTTWCQGQVVKSNTTFNAFVVADSPGMSQQLVPVSMTRTLELDDDMKEYWGFYLLQGSTVTVSACVRWPGASLIMIKGYKHLQECAYIGDDSSEELDELLEARRLGLLADDGLLDKLLKRVDNPANIPDAMRRHKGGVQFHHPSNIVNDTSSSSIPTQDITERDPKELKEILDKLHSIRQAAKLEAQKKYKPPPHLVAVPALHRHRDTNVDRDERRWLSFKDLDSNNNDDNINEIIDKTHKDNVHTLSNENYVHTTATEKATNSYIESVIKPARDTKNNITEVTTEKLLPEEHFKKNLEEEYKLQDNNTTTNSNGDEIAESESSIEVYEEVLKKLKSLGDRGNRVLQKLHQAMEITSNKVKSTEELHKDLDELDRLSQVLIEAIDEERRRPERTQKRHEARMNAKVKRDLFLGGKDFVRELNEDDEARDFAAEEGVQSDGYAEHHERVNETTGFDMSNSEFWSSFSSSEEALLECEGLILNLPLTPHSLCAPGVTEVDREKAAQRNAVTYRVPANGYYFFVFNSENEVQTNFINVKFDMQKTVYDVARTALRECKNSTEKCKLSLDLFSSQKVVLELPLRDNASLWNEQFVVISECEPRTSVYVICVVAVPLLIMMFAFQ